MGERGGVGDEVHGEGLPKDMNEVEEDGEEIPQTIQFFHHHQIFCFAFFFFFLGVFDSYSVILSGLRFLFLNLKDQRRGREIREEGKKKNQVCFLSQ